MGKLKKIGIGLGIGVGGFFIFMIIMGIIILQTQDTVNVPNDDSIIQENQEIPDWSNDIEIPPKSYTKSLDDLLPTIDELGLNWRVDEKVDPNTKLVEMILSEDAVESYNVESIGLLESVSQKYTKLGTPSTWKYWATVSLYKFNTSDEASQQWSNIKDFQNKNRAFDIYEENENCRSIQESRTINDRHTDLCYTNNILVLIEYTTDVAIGYYDDFPLLPMINKNIKNNLG